MYLDFVTLRERQIWGKGVIFPSNAPIITFSYQSTTQTDGPMWWFIDEGPACKTKRLPLLTPTTTVSSPWNLGINWSPRKISDWLRGRKRHSTFMLHSAGTSAMAQIQGGGRMLLSAERKDDAEAGGDLSLIGAWSDRQNQRRRMRSHCFLLRGQEQADNPDKLRQVTVYLCAAGRWFLVAVRRAG